ncbi:MAG: protein disulfide oxidoreductase [Acinetobacter sp.]|nr:protein disulfide oxidoreductase [Acinetobacter sp.]
MLAKIKRFLIKDFLPFVLILIIIYSIINFWRQPTLPQNPVWQLQDYQGQTINLQQHSHNQAVLIYFWGSWCHVCAYSTPKVQQVAQSSPVVSIAVQSGSNRELAQYLREHRIGFPTVNDEQGELFALWQGKVTPSYVILKDGQVAQSFVGLQPVWLLKLRLWWAGL